MRLHLSACLLIFWGASGPHMTQAWTPIGDGIEYQEFHLSDPNNVFVARMDRHNANCTLESSIGQGRLSGGTETVSAQAARYDDAINYWHRDWGRRNDVVVAINGDFYNTSTGVPASGQLHSGWYAKRLSLSAYTLSFGWTLNRVPFMIGSALHRSDQQILTFSTSGNTQPFQGINRERGADELIIYTPQYNSHTNTNDTGVEVVLEMTRPAMVVAPSDPAWGHVRAVYENQGSTPIPFDHVVLSATGTAASSLLASVSIGDRVGISQNFSSDSRMLETYAEVGGSYLFLVDGVVQELVATGAVTRNPRTAIAYNADYLFFVVVDGRSTASMGMNMAELGAFCTDYLGATYGINQDGGGSSTMVVHGEVMNDPSDGRERSVANGMMMINLQPKSHSDTFMAGDQIKATSSTSVYLGPGTNYAAFATVARNAEGIITDHSLRGIRAKENNWWKCDWGSTIGWIRESQLALVTPGGLPFFLQHPVDQTGLCVGDGASFAVAASGQGSLAYRWQKDGLDLMNDARYTGTDTSSLVITSVSREDAGSYRCTVMDDNGHVTSHSAALELPKYQTMITQQPVSQAAPPVPHGADITFNVLAVGDEPISYRWQKNGDNLADDTHYSGTATDALAIGGVNVSDNGSYRCVVTAGCGVAYSLAATLKVISADFDEDGDVDIADFGHLQACFSGPTVPASSPGCLDARLDADSDVDREDFMRFMNCFTGPGHTMEPSCLD